MKIVATFFNYKWDSLRDAVDIKRDFLKIDPEYLKYMKYDYRDRIKRLNFAIERNQDFLLTIVGEYHSLLKL